MKTKKLLLLMSAGALITTATVFSAVSCYEPKKEKPAKNGNETGENANTNDKGTSNTSDSSGSNTDSTNNNTQNNPSGTISDEGSTGTGTDTNSNDNTSGTTSDEGSTGTGTGTDTNSNDNTSGTTSDEGSTVTGTDTNSNDNPSGTTPDEGSTGPNTDLENNSSTPTDPDNSGTSEMSELNFNVVEESKGDLYGLFADKNGDTIKLLLEPDSRILTVTYYGKINALSIPENVDLNKIEFLEEANKKKLQVTLKYVKNDDRSKTYTFVFAPFNYDGQMQNDFSVTFVKPAPSAE